MKTLVDVRAFFNYLMGCLSLQCNGETRHNTLIPWVGLVWYDFVRDALRPKGAFLKCCPGVC